MSTAAYWHSPMVTAQPVGAARANQCTAKSKRSGQQCRRSAMIGKHVCMMHGGKTPTGLASPNTKHGLRSRYMPKGLLPKYQAALADPALLEQTRNLALTEARIGDLLEQLDAAGGRARWEALSELHTRMELSLPIDTHAELRNALDELGSIIQAGRSDYEHWDALLTTMDLQRKIADTERKRIQAAEQSIPVTSLMLFMANLQDVLLRNIEDLSIRARIASELDRMLLPGPNVR
jgi:hypothetical protein